MTYDKSPTGFIKAYGAFVNWYGGLTSLLQQFPIMIMN